MALFGHSSSLVTELPTLAVLMAHFGHYIAKFDGVPSELPPGGSSDGTLLTVVELQTLAVLMALFGPDTSLVNKLQTLAVLMAHFSHYIAKYDRVQFVDKTPK